MKAGRFVVDTHVHAQRFAAGKGISERPPEVSGGSQWGTLGKTMSGLEPYDNTAAPGVRHGLLRRRHVRAAAGLRDDRRAQPRDRRALARPVRRRVRRTEYIRRCRAGEEEWSIDGVCDELDRLLGTGRFVAIGESLPYMPAPWDKTALVSRVDAIANIMRIVEVAQQHGVAARIHTGIPYGYTAAYSYGPIGPANVNPLWMLDIAAAFPDVTLIFDHGGIQAGWWERFYEECLTVIAANDNVYVETGLWWRELYEKPLMDPNIGPVEAAVGHRLGREHADLLPAGRHPPSYAVQLRGEGIPHYQVDYWGWSLRELTSVRISQDDLNLILGGNAARIFDLDVPHTRMFKAPSDQVGRRQRAAAAPG